MVGGPGEGLPPPSRAAPTPWDASTRQAPPDPSVALGQPPSPSLSRQKPDPGPLSPRGCQQDISECPRSLPEGREHVVVSRSEEPTPGVKSQYDLVAFVTIIPIVLISRREEV